jgi:hypothetical protein
VAEGSGAALAEFLARLTSLDHPFEVRWRLTARQPWLQEKVFVDMKNIGALDASRNSITLQRGAMLTVDFPMSAKSFYSVVFKGKAGGDTSGRVGSESFALNSSEDGTVSLSQAFQSEQDTQCHLSLRLNSGRFEITSIEIREATSSPPALKR